MNSRLRRGALGFGMLCTLGTVSVPAFAQHVVTEDEAAKLTLEALTAPPPRPVYRPVIRTSYRYLSVRGRWHARATRVAYHVPVTARAHHRHHR